MRNPRKGSLVARLRGTSDDKGMASQCLDDVRAHGRDERVGVTQYFDGPECRYHLVRALAAR
jgi:hypothetical protein